MIQTIPRAVMQFVLSPAARTARRTITKKLNRDRMKSKRLTKKEVGSQLKSGDAK
jgi:hypothetical protein